MPYTVTDNAGATSTANLVITVTGTNDAPVAIADTAAASEDNALTITPATLLGNDTDIDNGTTLSINSVQGAVNGSVALVGGNVVFTPAAANGPAGFVHLHRQRQQRRHLYRHRHGQRGGGQRCTGRASSCLHGGRGRPVVNLCRHVTDGRWRR